MIDWVLTARLAGVAATGVAALLFATLIGVALSVRRLQRQAAAEGDRWRRQVDRLGGDLAQLASANLALRQYLTSLSERVDDSRQVAGAQPAAAAGRAYDLAARMAAGGAATDDLVSNCGLTRAEAELAVLVHGTRNRPAPGYGVTSPSRGGVR